MKYSFFTQGVHGAPNDIIVEVEEKNVDTNTIGIEIKGALAPKHNINYDNCFEREEKEKEGIIFDIGATAPMNGIGLKCFEKERKEVYGFKYGAPAEIAARSGTNSDNVKLFEAPTCAFDITVTFRNNIGGFLKAPIDAVTKTVICDNKELFGAPLDAFFTACTLTGTVKASSNVDTLVVFTVV